MSRVTPARVSSPARAPIALALALLAACKGSGPPAPAPTGWTEVVLATEPGLSGLAVDAQGALWTVAERAARAYRVTLPAPGAATPPRVEAVPVAGVPPGTDLEGIAVLGPDRYALGTERTLGGAAAVLLAERRGGGLAVTATIELPAARVGIALSPNHGAEGVCGAGDTILAAIEGAGEADGRRWAPVIRIERGAIARVHRLWLTTPTGKLSGLDCAIGADGAITGWAVERHFEVTRLLRFALPAGDAPVEITPAVAHDLGAALAGNANLEGIAQLPDGRLVTVVDNQWRTLQGPSRLFVQAAATR